MYALIIDTETTGLIDTSADLMAESQPDIVQLAALLVDTETWKVVASISCYVATFGVAISPEAGRLHGITEQDRLSGMAAMDALCLFNTLLYRAQAIVAHNVEFDLRILHIAAHRAKIGLELSGQQAICTMLLCRDLLRIPGRSGFKLPSLRESAAALLDVPPAHAHDALADARTCLAIYRVLFQRTGVVSAS